VRGTKGAMTVPPSPSFLLAKPFVGAGEGSDDGGFAGLDVVPEDVGSSGPPWRLSAV
jgi:hypothetical protein